MARIRRLLAPVMVLVLLLSSAAIMLPARQALAADYWSIAIIANAGSDGSDDSLEFGTGLSATDGFDGGIDLPTAPPAPGATFRCYFQIADAIFPQLNKDYRDMLASAPGSTIIWTLNIQSSSQPIDLSWSEPTSAGVPVDVSLVLSGGGQTIDMRTTSSATYASGTHTLTITASRPTTPVSVDDDTSDDSQDEGADADSIDDTADDTADDSGDDASNDATPDTRTNEGVPQQDGSVDDMNLIIMPAQVLPGQEVTISSEICNSGNESVTRTVFLTVDGAAEQSQTVAISGGACQQVTFRVSRPVPGTYQVAIDGMAGQFSVLAATTVTNNSSSGQRTGFATPGIIAVIAVVIVLVVALVVVFRRT